MPPILADIAKKANVKDHTQLGLSAIGGSRVIQHWDAPQAEKEKGARTLLKAGSVDVFTMAPIYLPDKGIENFVKLGVENNPKIRIFVQENWLPWDDYNPEFKAPETKVDHNAPTVESLRKMHAIYFNNLDEHVVALNKKYDTKAVRVAPVGQAVIALRAKILAGGVPGLKEQNDLFSDAIGHARPPLQALVAYVYYGLIYQRSPVGLKVPAVLAKTANADELNGVLQQIAWDAVTQHPLSGVTAASGQVRLDEATKRLTRLIQYEEKEGYKLINDKVSIGGGYLIRGMGLAPGDWVSTIEMTLEAGKSYTVLAAGDDDVRDIDVDLQDSQGKVVGQNDESGTIQHRPKTTQVYRIRMRLFASRNNVPCVCLVIVMAKP
jgi:hypothetical protein